MPELPGRGRGSASIPTVEADGVSSESSSRLAIDKSMETDGRHAGDLADATAKPLSIVGHGGGSQ